MSEVGFFFCAKIFDFGEISQFWQNALRPMPKVKLWCFFGVFLKGL